MGAFVYHSDNIEPRIPEYAQRLGVEPAVLEATYRKMLVDETFMEEPRKSETAFYISFIDMEGALGDPLEERFYCLLKNEIPTVLQPRFKIDWPTFKNRWLRVWEQIYNIVINKIPFHCVRLTWLRLGGMKIGKGSSVWRHTEVIGIENIVIGDDSVVGWHCQMDGRCGLIIGDHVTIASHVLMIAGGHDFFSSDFRALGRTLYIDDYAWIASRAIITMPARIGEGAVVGAGTVVNKDVEPYKIVGGFNAKPIADRPRDLSYKVGGKSLFTFLH